MAGSGPQCPVGRGRRGGASAPARLREGPAWMVFVAGKADDWRVGTRRPLCGRQHGPDSGVPASNARSRSAVGRACPYGAARPGRGGRSLEVPAGSCRRRRGWPVRSLRSVPCHHLDPPPRGQESEGLAAAGWGDSNSGPPLEGLPGGGCAGCLTCGSLAPVVTAGARCSPLPAGSACTQRVPARSGPVRSRTPPALRSSATRDRSAGRARQGRSLPQTIQARYRE